MEIEKSFDQTVDELLRVSEETSDPTHLDPRELEHIKRLVLRGIGHSAHRRTDHAYLYLAADETNPLARKGLEHVDEEQQSLRDILTRLRAIRDAPPLATAPRELAAYELMFARRIDRMITETIVHERLERDMDVLIRRVTRHYEPSRVNIVVVSNEAQAMSSGTSSAYTFIVRREKQSGEFIVLVYSGQRPNELYCFIANVSLPPPVVEAPRRIVLTTRLSEAFLGKDQSLSMGVTGFFYVVHETMRISREYGRQQASAVLRHVSELFYYCDLATLMAFHLAFLRRFYLEYYLTPEEERREAPELPAATGTYETKDPIDTLCETLTRLDVPLMMRRYGGGGEAMWTARVAKMIEQEANIDEKIGYTKQYIFALQSSVVAVLLDEASQPMSREQWAVRLSAFRQYRN